MKFPDFRDLLSRIKEYPFISGYSLALVIYVFCLALIVHEMKHPSKREITQIATVSDSQTTSFSGVVALCDDGTVWLYNFEQWQRLPDIPEPGKVADSKDE